MATEEVSKSDQDETTNDDPLLSLTKGLKFLKYEYSLEKVKTSHFIFPSDVDDFKLENLSNFGREVIRKYLHVGIVSDACEKPYKQYEVLLVSWPSNIPRSVYEDKNRTHLVHVKKVPTIIFSVPEKRLNKYMQSRCKIPMDDIIASTVILTEADDWRLMEANVMISLFNIVDRKYSHVSEGRDAWKTYPTKSLNSQWKQMIFLCCLNYDVGYHVKKMTTRNWARMCRGMFIDENYQSSENMLDYEIPKGGIYDLLVLWSRHPALIRDMIQFLKGVNEKKPCLLPLDILEKLKVSLVETLFVTKRFACDQCDLVSSSNALLKMHMMTHTGEKPFKCEICNRKFARLFHLKVHLRAHKGDDLFQCEYCGRSFSQKFTLKYHLAGKHHAIDDFNYRCYSCKAQYESDVLLREHIVLHANDKKFKCSICVRRFVTQSDLNKHMQNHNKDKPFDCHICGKMFLWKRVLTNHYRTHSEKTFMCDFCGKAFSENVMKRRHELLIHNKFGSVEVNSKELGKVI